MSTDLRPCVCAGCGAEGETYLPGPVYCPECLPKHVGPGQRLATCRECGAQGYESANDPAPGLCPACLATRVTRTVLHG